MFAKTASMSMIGRPPSGAAREAGDSPVPPTSRGSFVDGPTPGPIDNMYQRIEKTVVSTLIVFWKVVRLMSPPGDRCCAGPAHSGPTSSPRHGSVRPRNARRAHAGRSMERTQDPVGSPRMRSVAVRSRHRRWRSRQQAPTATRETSTWHWPVSPRNDSPDSPHDFRTARRSTWSRAVPRPEEDRAEGT